MQKRPLSKSLIESPFLQLHKWMENCIKSINSYKEHNRAFLDGEKVDINILIQIA